MIVRTSVELVELTENEGKVQLSSSRTFRPARLRDWHSRQVTKLITRPALATIKQVTSQMSEIAFRALMANSGVLAKV